MSGLGVCVGGAAPSVRWPTPWSASSSAMRYHFKSRGNMKLRTLPVFLAFLAMGFGDAVGPFVSLAKSEFQLSNAVASLIPFVGFSMFGLLSIPVGLVQD